MITWAEFSPSIVGIVLLVAVATLVLAAARVTAWWSPALAVLRGGVQLALVSLVLSGVIGEPRWVAVALAVMFTVASVTAARRISWSWRNYWIIAVGMLAGLATSTGIIFTTGLIEFAPRYVLAMGGILIGGSMTIATLAARRLRQATVDRWGEVEGWLALGSTPRLATIDIARHAVREAMLPSTDQTKTTGLVTLPGAFIGAIFGGLDPLEAGRFQIVVLAGIIAAGAITAVIVAFGLAPVTQRPPREE